MPAIDLSPVLGILGTAEYQVTHYAPQTSDASGMVSDDAVSLVEIITGSLQPNTDQEVTSADGERINEAWNFYTLGNMSPRLGKQPGDSIEIDGDTYRVVGAKLWAKVGGLNEFILERVP